ncbi:MAG: ABC transporter permease [Oscillospiraceae bacterium]
MRTGTIEIKKQKRKRPSFFGELWKNKFLYLLALPAILYTFLYGYMTLPYLVIAFKKYDFRKGLLSPFIGLKNFEFFFKSSWAWTVTRNTIVLNVLFILAVTLCALVLAILINEVRRKYFVRVAQSAMLLPYFISWVIVSYMLNGILNTETGLLNSVIASMGGDKISFYSTPGYWYPILIILRVWKSAGYVSIIYLSAITGIDEGLYEAAYIDGASRWKRIIHITLPLLVPTICVLTLMDVGRIFYGDFGMFYAIIRDNGQLMPIAEVIDTYVFRTFKLTGDPGISMAIGLYQSLVGFVLVFGTNKLVKKIYPEGALF